MKNLLKETIETDRLILEPVSLKYVNDMFAELTEEITRFLSIYPPVSIQIEIDYVNNAIKRMKNGESFVLVAIDKITREFLGGIELKGVYTKTPEIGIWLKKSAHGKKIGREAALALKKWAEENLDYDYIIYPFHKDNFASKKVAETLGGIYKSSGIRVFPSGKKLDEMVYYIRRS